MTAIYPVCLILLPLGAALSLPGNSDPRVLAGLSFLAAAVSLFDLSSKKTVWMPVFAAIVLSSAYAVTLDGRFLPFLFAVSLVAALSVSRLLPPWAMARPLAFSVFTAGFLAGRLSFGGSGLSRQLQAALVAVVLVTGLFTLLAVRFPEKGGRPLSLLPLSLLSALLFPSLKWYLYLLPLAGSWLGLLGRKSSLGGSILGIVGLCTTPSLALLALGVADPLPPVSLLLAALCVFLPARTAAFLYFLVAFLEALVTLRHDFSHAYN